MGNWIYRNQWQVPNTWDTLHDHSQVTLHDDGCKLRWLSFLSTKRHPSLFLSKINPPIGSMYGIFTYIWLIFMVNVVKSTIHGTYGLSRRNVVTATYVILVIPAELNTTLLHASTPVTAKRNDGTILCTAPFMAKSILSKGDLL